MHDVSRKSSFSMLRTSRKQTNHLSAEGRVWIDVVRGWTELLVVGEPCTGCLLSCSRLIWEDLLLLVALGCQWREPSILYSLSISARVSEAIRSCLHGKKKEKIKNVIVTFSFIQLMYCQWKKKEKRDEAYSFN